VPLVQRIPLGLLVTLPLPAMDTDKVEVGRGRLIVIGAVLAVFPAASRAIAARVYGPGIASVVFQNVEKGLVVSSAPRFVPLSWN
jgi:hypothetical protein